MIDDDWLEAHGRAHGLTRRESQVIALITQGLSNAEIARATYLSINSVKTYIRSTYRKIEVARRAQAVVWGMRNGFMDAAAEAVQPAEAAQPDPAEDDLPDDRLSSLKVGGKALSRWSLGSPTA